jgi:hypothetical protein
VKVRLLAVLSGLSVTVFAAGALSAAPPVKPNPAAVEAVALVFLGPEPYRSRNRANARVLLEAGALRAPRERRTANVLLARGLTGAGVQALLAPRHMDLISFEAKVPTPGPPGQMITLWLGSSVLLSLRSGSLEVLVDKAIGRERARFLQTAQRRVGRPGMEESVAEYRAAAGSPELALYRLEVVGTREALFSLLRDPAVGAVLVNENAAAVTEFEREKADSAGMMPAEGDLAADSAAEAAEAAMWEAEQAASSRAR